MTAPFRVLHGPTGDLWSYASSITPGAPVSGHVVLCHDLPRGGGSAKDVNQTYPALADRLTRETGQRVVTGILRGAGASDGDFSAQGWLDDTRWLMDSEVPVEAPRWLVGFGFGGVLALRVAAQDERVAGVACLGTPADLSALTADPAQLVERSVRTGVISTPGYPASLEAWINEFSRPATQRGCRSLEGATPPGRPRCERPGCLR